MRARQGGVGGAAGDVFADEVEQHQVILGATRDDVIAAREEDFDHRLGVIQHLFLVFGERRIQRFEEGNRFRRDHLHQRAALHTGEDSGIEFLLQLFIGAGEDETAARAAQGFVRGGGNDIGNRHRVRVQPRCDQPGDVRHIDQQISADAVGNLAETLEIKNLRIGGKAGDDHLRLVLAGHALQRVVINQAGFQVKAVVNGVVQPAGKADRRAVRQMAAVAKIHAEYRVARVKQGEEDGSICLRAGMRLHIGIIRAEEHLGALDGKRFDNINMLTAAVIALAGVALGVLVG